MQVRRRTATALMCAAGAALAIGGGGAAGASVRVGTAGWSWGNPTPQGNTLRALDFAGPRGYAAGDFGTVLRSDDAGATWSGLPSGVSAALSLVQTITPDSFVVGGGCVVRRSDNGGQTFRRIYFVAPTCTEPVDALAFPSSAVGYLALADGTVVRTADAGASFARRTAVPGSRSSAQSTGATPTDLAFLNDSTGFVATSAGQIHETTDGGGSWKVVLDVKRAVRDITFVDALRGFAVGDGSLLLRTVDGGATWTPLDIGAPAPVDLKSIRCVPGAAATDPISCLATATAGGAVVRTIDGGAHFSVLSPATDPIFAIAYASPARVIAAGAAGTTVVSDDAGATFAGIGSRLSGNFSRVRAGGPGTVYAVGDNGALALSADGGSTWVRADVPTSERLVDVTFPSATVGYALDGSGGLFRTANGGTGWSTLDTGTTAHPNAVFAPSEQRVLLFGPTGIRRSTDGGVSFSGVSGKAVARTKIAGYDRAGSALFAYGSTNVIRSTDGGATWTAIKDPGTPLPRHRREFGARVRQVDFVSAQTGYEVDILGRAWRTHDGGKTWRVLFGLGTQNIGDIAFSNAVSGYAVLHNFGTDSAGFVLRTDDNGSTWAPQLVTQAPIASLAIGGSTAAAGDFLLAGDSALLTTTTGGRAGAPSSMFIRTDRGHLSKPARIRVTGKLTPARGNELVVVSARVGTRWIPQIARVAANGSFTTSWNLRKGTTRFVAQWAGDDRSAGRGTTVLTVNVGR